MNERITIIFDNQETGEVLDLEIPLNITANDLIIALNNAYKLNMDMRLGLSENQVNSI